MGGRPFGRVTYSFGTGAGDEEFISVNQLEGRSIQLRAWAAFLPASAVKMACSRGLWDRRILLCFRWMARH